MRRQLPSLASIAAATAFACSTFAPRHTSTVALVATHSVLSTVQDTEVLLVCGRTTAPPIPYCVPLDLHHQISSKLATAFRLELDIAATLRDLPPSAPQPPQVLSEISDANQLLTDILALIPPSPQKVQLSSQIGVGK